MASFETDPNIRELHKACKEGSADILGHLLKQQVRATTFDPRGNPPIVVAATHGNADCVRLLCQNRVHVDQTTYKSGETSLTLVLGLFRAENTMRKFGDDESEEYNRSDKNRRSHNARLEQVVSVLLELGADPVTPRHLGASPLHIACLSGFDNAVRMLLSGLYYKVDDYGEQIRPGVHAVDGFRRTPLHRASIKGHGQVAKTLLRFGADPLARDKSGKSSLQVALEQRKDEFVASMFDVWCTELKAGVVLKMDEMMRRVCLMKEEIHRPCQRVCLRSSGSSNDYQSSLIVAGRNADLVKLLLKGPKCLQDVMEEEVCQHRSKFFRKKQVRAAQKHIRDLMRKRRDQHLGKYGVTETLSNLPRVKEKEESKWLYIDECQGGKVVGPVPSSKMRDWWQQGKLDLGLRIYNISSGGSDGSINVLPPDAGAMCNMPARGQGPSALGPVWDPKAMPHRKRNPLRNSNFKPLREVIVEYGGIDKTFGSSNVAASVSIATKILIKSKKWKKKASKSAFARNIATIRLKYPELQDSKVDDEESWKTVEDEGILTEDEDDIRGKEDAWIGEFRLQQYEKLWISKKLIEMPDSRKYGRTVLANACAEGWKDVVLQLLSISNVNLSSRDRYGFTPLALACQQGHTEIVRLLLESAGFETRTSNNSEMTQASNSAKLHEVRKLNKFEKILQISDGSYKWTPLTWAAIKGHLEIVQMLLFAGADLEGESQSPASGPLGVACTLAGNEKIVKLLVKTGADVNRVGGESGKITPLHAGCAQGNTATVKSLLKSSRNVIMDPRDANGCTPLMLACRGGHLKCVKMLLDRGADWRLTTTPGNWTCLMYAAEGGYTKIVYRLLHWKRKPRTNQSLYAPTPEQEQEQEQEEDQDQERAQDDAGLILGSVSTTATKGELKVAQREGMKTSAIPKLPKIANLTQTSPVSASLHNLALGRLAAVSIKHKAALRVVEQNQGLAPSVQHYHGMAFTPSPDALTSKLGQTYRSEIHKDTKPQELSGKMPDNRTRASSKRIDRSHFGRSGSKLSRHKLKLVTTRESHTGCNALHLAARYGYVGVLKHLLRCRLPSEVVDARSNTNQTPLGSACYFGHEESAELLIEAGANIEMRQGDLETGPTPLLQAAAGGHMQILRNLVSRGANLEVQNTNRQTAQMLAGENGHKEIYSWLMAQRKLAQRARARELRLEQEAEEAKLEEQRIKEMKRLEKEREFRAAAVRANQEMRRKERERLAAEEEEKRRRLENAKPSKKKKKKKTKKKKKKKKSDKKIVKKKKKVKK